MRQADLQKMFEHIEEKEDLNQCHNFVAHLQTSLFKDSYTVILPKNRAFKISVVQNASADPSEKSLIEVYSFDGELEGYKPITFEKANYYVY